jgi:hypothetical protein
MCKMFRALSNGPALLKSVGRSFNLLSDHRLRHFLAGTQKLTLYLAIIFNCFSTGTGSRAAKTTTKRAGGRRRGGGRPGQRKAEPAPTAAELDVDMDNWTAGAAKGTEVQAA